jgi:predicted DNA-binding transcriptional regulator AlpA
VHDIYIDANEVGRMLGLSAQTVHKLELSKKIPRAKRLTPKVKRWSKERVVRFMQTGKK